MRKVRSWFLKNWKWTILGVVLISAILFFGILMLMKSSDVYKMALEKAQSNPEIIKVLGQPIKDGFIFSGSIQVSGPSGHANIAFSISGPSSEGKVYAVADKSAGRWAFKVLEAEIEGMNDRINLLNSEQLPK